MLNPLQARLTHHSSNLNLHSPFPDFALTPKPSPLLETVERPLTVARTRPHRETRTNSGTAAAAAAAEPEPEAEAEARAIKGGPSIFN